MYSQAVTHPSTNTAQPCLTSVIRRELVCSRLYGRRQVQWAICLGVQKPIVTGSWKQLIESAISTVLLSAVSQDSLLWSRWMITCQRSVVTGTGTGIWNFPQ